MEQGVESLAIFAGITHELGVLARRISTLAGSDGAFVGEITTILHQCARVSQQGSGQALIYNIGSYFNGCLDVSQTHKCPLSGHRFKLYTVRQLSNVPVIMYPRNWYEEHRNIRILDAYVEAMMVNVCQMLSARDIVLYISPEPPTLGPPWVLDDLLGKRLADNDLPGFIDNYDWALSTCILPSISQSKHSHSFHRQQSVAKSSIVEPYAALSGREKPLHTSRTSDTGVGLQMTKAFRISYDTSIDAMDIDRNPGDNLLDNSQAGWLPQISRPTVMEAEPQSRSPPAIQKLVPAQGSVKGGTEVTLLGHGFYQGLEVIFGAMEATATTFWGDKCLVCVAPPAVKAGYITISFKKDRGLPNAAQQQTQPRRFICIYKYVDDQEPNNYGYASTNFEHNKQRSREDAKSAPQQQITGALTTSTTTTPMPSASEWSRATWNNFAMIRCLSGYLAPPIGHRPLEKMMLELLDSSLVSLRGGLAVLPLEDDTILCAILLWLMEWAKDREDSARLHWNGVEVLLQCRPDFDITRALAKLSTHASSFLLSNQQRKSIADAHEFIAAAFKTAMENITTSEEVGQNEAVSAAPTPAATVYSPWSETDVDPPPYMLSPTPLKQACLIYAAVNAGRKEIRIT